MPSFRKSGHNLITIASFIIGMFRQSSHNIDDYAVLIGSMGIIQFWPNNNYKKAYHLKTYVEYYPNKPPSVLIFALKPTGSHDQNVCSHDQPPLHATPPCNVTIVGTTIRT